MPAPDWSWRQGYAATPGLMEGLGRSLRGLSVIMVPTLSPCLPVPHPGSVPLGAPFGCLNPSLQVSGTVGTL